jgi:hypothetical protein
VAVCKFRTVSLIAVLAIGASACSSARHSVAPKRQPTAPPPNVAAFLPPDYRVVNATQVNLDGSATPQLAVTAVGTASGTGFAPSTVIVLAWDPIARRWTAVFDASKLDSYQTGLQSGENGPGLIGGTGTPAVAVVHDHRDHTNDLVYWLQAAAGNGTELIVGVVHYTNQFARVVWNFNADEAHSPLSGQATIGVIGSAPHQQVKVTLPWQTAVDSRSSAARLYSFVVAPDAQLGVDQYGVVSDDRPLVGVGLVAVPNSDQGQVVYIAPQATALGILQVGDLVNGIDGEAPPALGLLGPAVIDQVAQHHPGDTIALDVVRQGRQLVVRIRLGEWNLPLGTDGYRDIPTPGDAALFTM